MYDYITLKIHDGIMRDLRREAKEARLAREAKTQRPSLAWRTLLWLGNRPIMWGTHLQSGQKTTIATHAKAA
ncbi:MAG: hypothetical protein IT330_03980 [Anaerolineae bacterium]|nr:hypothetical protein [Anaerolineae bacterium]